jgi:hypothetical protein
MHIFIGEFALLTLSYFFGVLSRGGFIALPKKSLTIEKRNKKSFIFLLLSGERLKN